jgi:hypothetical protein
MDFTPGKTQCKACINSHNVEKKAKSYAIKQYKTSARQREFNKRVNRVEIYCLDEGFYGE